MMKEEKREIVERISKSRQSKAGSEMGTRNREERRDKLERIEMRGGFELMRERRGKVRK